MKSVLPLLFFFYAFGCNKPNQVISSDQWLSKKNIEILERNNPGIKINPSNILPEQKKYFTNITLSQFYIDSIKKAINTKVNETPQQHLSVKKTGDKNHNESQFQDDCGAGGYNASVGGAGLFSSFNMSFQYLNGAVSNANISVNGLPLLWSWGNVSSHYFGISGCTQGTASWLWGILGWSTTVHFNWTFDAQHCLLNYTQGSGPCGTILSYN